MRLKIWNALLVGTYNRICLCRSDSVSIRKGALDLYNSYAVNKLNRKKNSSCWFKMTKRDVTLTFKARRIIRLSEFQCLFAIFFIIMENIISNIYSVDIYGQLHLEPSTAVCSFSQKFDLGGGKNGTSCNSITFYFFSFVEH